MRLTLAIFLLLCTSCAVTGDPKPDSMSCAVPLKDDTRSEKEQAFLAMIADAMEQDLAERDSLHLSGSLTRRWTAKKKDGSTRTGGHRYVFTAEMKAERGRRLTVSDQDSGEIVGEQFVKNGADDFLFGQLSESWVGNSATTQRFTEGIRNGRFVGVKTIRGVPCLVIRSKGITIGEDFSKWVEYGVPILEGFEEESGDSLMEKYLSSDRALGFPSLLSVVVVQKSAGAAAHPDKEYDVWTEKVYVTEPSPFQSEVIKSGTKGSK